jgi:hypothetical protein
MCGMANAEVVLHLSEALALLERVEGNADVRNAAGKIRYVLRRLEEREESTK